MPLKTKLHATNRSKYIAGDKGTKKKKTSALVEKVNDTLHHK